MKPLIVLILTFIVAAFALKVVQGHHHLALAGRIALSVMLVFTAIGHFIYTKGMVMMVPPSIPMKVQLVYFTGVFEILAAVGLLIDGFKVFTGWALIVFFILLLPANIYAAIRHIDYQRADFKGPGVNYLWFRISLQLFFVGWTYISTVRF